MVEVYKTNVTNQKQANKIIRKLNEKFPDYKINFDLEDCDNILRVESLHAEFETKNIIQLIRSFGFNIEPLTDDVNSFDLQDN